LWEEHEEAVETFVEVWVLFGLEELEAEICYSGKDNLVSDDVIRCRLVMAKFGTMHGFID